MPRSTTSQIPHDRKLMEGAAKHFGAGPLLLGGRSVTQAEIVTALSERIEADEAVLQARAVLERRIADARQKHEATDPLIKAVKKSVHVMYAGAHLELGDFGLTAPTVRRTLTSDEKALAALRAKATREARHTMGKRQKLQIKGVLPVAPSEPSGGREASGDAPKPRDPQIPSQALRHRQRL